MVDPPSRGITVFDGLCGALSRDGSGRASFDLRQMRKAGIHSESVPAVLSKVAEALGGSCEAKVAETKPYDLLVNALYFLRSLLEVLLDFSDKFLAAPLTDYLPILQILLDMTSLEQVQAMKFWCMWPVGRWLRDPDIAGTQPSFLERKRYLPWLDRNATPGGPKSKFLFPVIGLTRKLFKNLIASNTRSRHAATFCYAMLQGVKRGCAPVDEDFQLEACLKHKSALTQVIPFYHHAEFAEKFQVLLAKPVKEGGRNSTLYAVNPEDCGLESEEAVQVRWRKVREPRGFPRELKNPSRHATYDSLRSQAGRAGEIFRKIGADYTQPVRGLPGFGRPKWLYPDPISDPKHTWPSPVCNVCRGPCTEYYEHFVPDPESGGDIPVPSEAEAFCAELDELSFAFCRCGSFIDGKFHFGSCLRCECHPHCECDAKETALEALIGRYAMYPAPTVLNPKYRSHEKGKRKPPCSLLLKISLNEDAVNECIRILEEVYKVEDRSDPDLLLTGKWRKVGDDDIAVPESTCCSRMLGDPRAHHVSHPDKHAQAHTVGSVGTTRTPQKIAKIVQTKKVKKDLTKVPWFTQELGLPFLDMREKEPGVVITRYGFALPKYENFLRYLDDCLDDEEPLKAKVALILEPLKCRVITKGEGLPYWLSQTFQQEAKEILRETPAFALTGVPVDGSHVYGLQLATEALGLDFPLWVSGDYKAATDGLSLGVNQCCLELLLKNLSATSRERKICRKVLGAHRVEYHEDQTDSCGPDQDLEPFLMQNGQLMGSLLSFPVLCLINLAAYWLALEEYTGRRFTKDELPVLVNGDDILFKADAGFYEVWKKWIGRAGFTLSPGKNYTSPNFLTVNSEAWLMRYKGGKPDFLKLRYLNAGLLLHEAAGPCRPPLRKETREAPFIDKMQFCLDTCNNPARTFNRLKHHYREKIATATSRTRKRNFKREREEKSEDPIFENVDPGFFSLTAACQLGGCGLKLPPDLRDQTRFTPIQQKIAGAAHHWWTRPATVRLNPPESNPFVHASRPVNAARVDDMKRHPRFEIVDRDKLEPMRKYEARCDDVARSVGRVLLNCQVHPDVELPDYLYRDLAPKLLYDHVFRQMKGKSHPTIHNPHEFWREFRVVFADTQDHIIEQHNQYVRYSPIDADGVLIHRNSGTSHPKELGHTSAQPVPENPVSDPLPTWQSPVCNVCRGPCTNYNEHFAFFSKAASRGPTDEASPDRSVPRSDPNMAEMATGSADRRREWTSPGPNSVSELASILLLGVEEVSSSSTRGGTPPVSTQFYRSDSWTVDPVFTPELRALPQASLAEDLPDPVLELIRTFIHPQWRKSQPGEWPEAKKLQEWIFDPTDQSYSWSLPRDGFWRETATLALCMNSGSRIHFGSSRLGPVLVQPWLTSHLYPRPMVSQEQNLPSFERWRAEWSTIASPGARFPGCCAPHVTYPAFFAECGLDDTLLSEGYVGQWTSNFLDEEYWDITEDNRRLIRHAALALSGPNCWCVTRESARNLRKVRAVARSDRHIEYHPRGVTVGVRRRVHVAWSDAQGRTEL
jgi:hypothetical protein